ncbi:hypothetical protein [Flagellimonas meridianipacifica]|uniref:Uncharacterized protein n=1 Tax=Flagellimonas meridianipacifica TaxID=1080225 RepID=A0A2T0MG63_9FLAO|nr:hypothetical protein [Allomuricauda pacifica]PRX56571.1 hypothetical protein CLV81_0568 [Allomuricauda pacifica]
MKYKLFFIVLMLGQCYCFGQTKREVEYKISPSELPQGIETLLSPFTEDAKRIRYYQEIDGDKKSYEAKFKKGRLRYSVEFDESGSLEDVEFIIRETDIPNESWLNIVRYLEQNFLKFTVKKIQQQYPVENKAPSKTLTEAFQNLILPYINYEFIVSAKKQKGYEQFEILFNSDGQFLSMRKSISSKYNHVLY